MNTWISFSSFSDEFQKLASGKVPIEKAEAKIFNQLMRGAPVKVKITPDAAAYGGGYFDQVKKEIGLSEKDYRVLAHELGHADIDKSLAGRVIQSRAARIANLASPLAAIGAGLLIAKGKKWGYLLPAAVAAPTLASEAIASIKGDKKVQDTGASEQHQRDYRRLAALMFGTYMVAPAINTAAAHIYSKLRR